MNTSTKSSQRPPRILPPLPTYEVRATTDFTPDGRGSFAGWASAAAAPINFEGPGAAPTVDYTTTFKALWSETGVYFFIHGIDHVLTSTNLADNSPLYMEDVVEVFLQPDGEFPLYLEYEISPFAKELPLLVPNIKRRFRGWLPWQYGAEQRVRKATAVYGTDGQLVADPKPMQAISAWSAEFFIPLELMAPMDNTELRPGVTWRANVYRIDHDLPGRYKRFEWSPITRDSFHDMARFGTFRFVE